MRILTHSLSLDPIGGIELSTYQDVVSLAAKGHDISLIYGQAGSLLDGYKGAGVSLSGPTNFEFQLRRPITSLLRFIPSARWAAARKPGIVWLKRFESIFWGQTVARYARAPLVVHLHHSPNFKRTAFLGRGVVHYIAISEFMREKWIEAGVPSDRISVIYNAVPTDSYPVGGLEQRDAVRESMRISNDVPVILCYGRLIREKGIEVLLEAWRIVSGYDESAVLVLVGGGDISGEAAIAAEPQLFENGRVLRFPLQTNVVPFLHACDVVVFPTLMEEGFGRVVVEGMSTGRPVIGSRIGAVPEILSGEMSRFLVTPGDSEELAAKIVEYLDWRRTNPTLGNECFRWVSDRFPFQRHLDEVEETLLTYCRS